MIPKRDHSFYRLPPDLRALYLTGMPKVYLDAPNTTPHFKNEKTAKGVLKSQTQQEAYEFIKTTELGDQRFILFCSFPSDQQAMLSVAGLLREKHRAGFNKFEFVHPAENLPHHDLVKDLYVVTGVHESDASIVSQVRKWIRTPLGAEIWVVLTAREPYRWFNEVLGVQPQYLFSFKEAVVSVG